MLVVGNRRIPGAFIQQLKMAAGMSCSVWPGKTVTPLIGENPDGGAADHGV